MISITEITHEPPFWQMVINGMVDDKDKIAFIEDCVNFLNLKDEMGKYLNRIEGVLYGDNDSSS